MLHRLDFEQLHVHQDQLLEANLVVLMLVLDLEQLFLVLVLDLEQLVLVLDTKGTSNYRRSSSSVRHEVYR